MQHLKPTTAYIPVSVEDRLPCWDTPVSWMMDDGSIHNGYWTEQEGRNWVKIELDDGYHESFVFSDFTHWLEKRENVFVLTEEELEGCDAPGKFM